MKTFLLYIQETEWDYHRAVICAASVEEAAQTLGGEAIPEDVSDPDQPIYMVGRSGLLLQELPTIVC